jgi:hypothetical protein
MDKVTSAIAYPTTITPDDKGYRQPAKGTTIFPFRFTVPPDVGSAIECGAEVRTRYTLTAYAKVRILGSFETLIHSVEVYSPLVLTDFRWMLLNGYLLIIFFVIQDMSLMFSVSRKSRIKVHPLKLH